MSEMQSPRSRKRARQRLFVIVIVTVPLLFSAVRILGPIPLRVRSASLSPLLAVQDYVWTWSVRTAPEAGTVVLIRPPDWRAEDRVARWRSRWNRVIGGWLKRPVESKNVGPGYIARLVVAAAGETVRILPMAVEVWTESGLQRRVAIDELFEHTLILEHRELIVPPDHIFVVALQRGYLDSRHWGTVPASAAARAVWARLWPFARFGLLDSAAFFTAP